MMQWNWKSAMAWYCAGLLWLSGIQHVANGFLFLGTVLDYHVAPAWLAVIVAAILPWFQLIVAAMLIAPGIHRRIPFTLVALLGIVFVVVQVTVLVRGIPVDCGCFGAVAKRPVGAASLLVAGSLVLAGGIGAWLSNRKDDLQESSRLNSTGTVTQAAVPAH